MRSAGVPEGMGRPAESTGRSGDMIYKGLKVKKGSKNVSVAINSGSCHGNWFKLGPWGN